MSTHNAWTDAAREAAKEARTKKDHQAAAASHYKEATRLSVSADEDERNLGKLHQAAAASHEQAAALAGSRYAKPGQFDKQSAAARAKSEAVPVHNLATNCEEGCTKCSKCKLSAALNDVLASLNDGMSLNERLEMVLNEISQPRHPDNQQWQGKAANAAAKGMSTITGDVIDVEKPRFEDPSEELHEDDAPAELVGIQTTPDGRFVGEDQRQEPGRMVDAADEQHGRDQDYAPGTSLFDMGGDVAAETTRLSTVSRDEEPIGNSLWVANDDCEDAEDEEECEEEGGEWDYGECLCNEWVANASAFGKQEDKTFGAKEPPMARSVGVRPAAITTKAPAVQPAINPKTPTAEGDVANARDWLTYNRDWPQEKRDKLDKADFAGPDQSFPIKTQEDLDAAIHSIGRASDPDTVKAGIKRIAKRKGLKLPDTETWNSNPEGHNQYTFTGAGRDKTVEQQKDVLRRNYGKMDAKGHQSMARQFGKQAKAEHEAGQHTEAAKSEIMRDAHKALATEKQTANSNPLTREMDQMEPETFGSPHGATMAAAGASLQTEHGPALDHALAAKDKSRDGDSDGAADSHDDAASEHEDQASEALSHGNQDDADDHLNAAALHRKAKAMHEATRNAKEDDDNKCPKCGKEMEDGKCECGYTANRNPDRCSCGGYVNHGVCVNCGMTTNGERLREAIANCGGPGGTKGPCKGGAVSKAADKMGSKAKRAGTQEAHGAAAEAHQNAADLMHKHADEARKKGMAGAATHYESLASWHDTQAASHKDSAKSAPNAITAQIGKAISSGKGMVSGDIKGFKKGSQEAMQASEKAGKTQDAGDHMAAGAAHQKAATAYAKKGNPYMAKQHSQAAKLHFQRADQLTGNNMPKVSKTTPRLRYDRASVLTKLTANCGEKEKQALNQLTDDALKLLVQNAYELVPDPQTGQAEKDKTRKEHMWESGGNPTEDEDEENDFDDANDKNEAGTVKGTKSLSTNEWWKQAPPEAREVLNEGLQARDQLRKRLIERLTANVQGANKERLAAEYGKMSLNKLKMFAAALPQTTMPRGPQVPPTTNEGEPFPLFLGRGGGPDDLALNTTVNQNDVLDVPVLNFDDHKWGQTA